MAVELFILRELGTLNATLSELVSVSTTVNAHLRPGEFRTLFNKIVEDIAKSYDVVTDNLGRLSGLESEAALVERFDALHAFYTENYLKEVHKPRAYAEDAYEDQILMKGMPESKTRFPLLRRSYERFDQFYDKWITNDAWLAMSIDNLFKRLQALLNEIAELKKKDPEDAFLIYSAAFTSFAPYLTLITQNRDSIRLTSDHLGSAMSC